jgi:hypothetical protein
MRFVSVEFLSDPNVTGRIYWYVCDIPSVEEGSVVLAPLGSHNHLQQGVVRGVEKTLPPSASIPSQLLKRIVRNLSF